MMRTPNNHGDMIFMLPRPLVVWQVGGTHFILEDGRLSLNFMAEGQSNSAEVENLAVKTATCKKLRLNCVFVPRQHLGNDWG